MTSLWPFGLTGRIIAIILAAIIILAGGGIGLHLYDRATSIRGQFVAAAADRITAVTMLIDHTPPQDRDRILEAIGNPWVRIKWSSTRPKTPKAPSSSRARQFSVLLRQNLKDLGRRPVEIFVAPHDWRDFWPNRRVGPRGRRDVPLVVASVALSDGSWLVFGMPVRMARLRWEIRLMSVIAVSILAIVLIAVWAARRVTRPVVQLAEAADRLGTDVRAAPLPDRGSREVRMAALAFNRMQERLRRMIDDRTLMLAAISHDLRTVLTRLKLRTEFIEDEHQRERAVADIDEMEAMLETSLTFARDDITEEPRRDIDLSALIQSLCDDLADAGGKATFEGEQGLVCHCQEVAMRRALSNLFGNAVKYGKDAIVTATHCDSEIRIEVLDRGPGIPESLRDRVFMPFYRVEPSRNRETGGTGLGLSVARNVFRRHGGDVTLHDRPGGGLRVLARLPSGASNLS